MPAGRWRPGPAPCPGLASRCRWTAIAVRHRLQCVAWDFERNLQILSRRRRLRILRDEGRNPCGFDLGQVRLLIDASEFVV